MALLRAMGSALSGLSAQQFRLDTIGDNLSNATTTGFKASRVEFQTLLSQTIRFGSAPQGQLGGVDPIQIGLGVQVGSVSRNFNQGELQATGVASDLAIDGSGFFILENGQGSRVFTRDGTFSINPQNLLHDPSTGFLVQGINADLATFTIPAGGPLEDVVVPVGNLQIAAATQIALFDGNLNSGGETAHMGTVLQSAPLLDGVGGPPATGATLLTALARATGTGTLDLLIDAGDTITVRATKGGRPLPEQRFFVGTSLPVGTDGFGTTLGEFGAFLERALGINTASGLTYGAIRDNDTNPNTAGASYNAPAVFAPSTAAAWTLAIPAVNFAADGVQAGDLLRFNSGSGAGQIARVTGIDVTGTILTLTALSPGLPLPVTGDQLTLHEPAGVTVSGPSTPWLADGALHVAGNAGLAHAISDLEILNATDNVSFAPFARIEAASGESVVSNGVVYDSIGNAHQVEFTYVLEARGVVDPISGAVGNTWRVFAEAPDSRLLGAGGAVEGTSRVIGGGQILFGTDGQFLSQAPLGAAGFATIQIPNLGAATPLAFTPDFSGMTGFANAASAAFMRSQDGFATGTLDDYSVGEDGIVTGIFSNGVTRPLAQVYLARFENPNGLDAIGENLFRAAVNSGQPIISAPGVQGNGAVVGGALEASNVDFAKEFTDLIVAQRAFQANARVISRADQLLEELVNIV